MFYLGNHYFGEKKLDLYRFAPCYYVRNLMVQTKKNPFLMKIVTNSISLKLNLLNQ